jgi:hypothetical protein
MASRTAAFGFVVPPLDPPHLGEQGQLDRDIALGADRAAISMPLMATGSSSAQRPSRANANRAAFGGEHLTEPVADLDRDLLGAIDQGKGLLEV